MVAAVAVGALALVLMIPGSAGAQTPTATPTETATATPTAEPTEGLVDGDVPESGVAILTVTAAAGPGEIVDALNELGCSAESIAITDGGAWLVYVPGAPDFVNADFAESLAAGSPFIVRCS
jgi:hypothetical protein